MNSINAPIHPEAVTGFQRIAYHESFVIMPDLEMIQQVRVVTVDENQTPIQQRILADENLNENQRQAALLRYQDQIVTKKTAGAFVDQTGKVVAADAEGAIPQKLFFQALNLGQLKAMGVTITDETPVATLLYILIGNEIANINARGDL